MLLPSLLCSSVEHKREKAAALWAVFLVSGIDQKQYRRAVVNLSEGGRENQLFCNQNRQKQRIQKPSICPTSTLLIIPHLLSACFTGYQRGRQVLPSLFSLFVSMLCFCKSKWWTCLWSYFSVFFTKNRLSYSLDDRLGRHKCPCTFHKSYRSTYKPPLKGDLEYTPLSF